MKTDKKRFKNTLSVEYKMYIGTFFRCVKMCLVHDHDYLVWKYIRCLRFMEYHQNANHKIRTVYWERKRNKIGEKVGLFIWPNSVGEGIRIWHYGNIIIHKDARVGKNCQLHGMNCIGNKGTPDSGTPVIGDNVNIGVGAVIVGNVCIANNITIAANAVVVNDCFVEGAVIGGIPAKILSDSGIGDQ